MLNDNNCDVGLCDDDDGGGRILTDITDSTGGTERMSPSASVCWLSWEPTQRPAVAAAQNHLVATLRITPSQRDHRQTVTPPQYTFYNQDLSPICRSARIIPPDYTNLTLSNTSLLVLTTPPTCMRQMFGSFLYNFDVAGSQFNKNMVDMSQISPVHSEKGVSVCLDFGVWSRDANICQISIQDSSLWLIYPKDQPIIALGIGMDWDAKTEKVLVLNILPEKCFSSS